MRKTTAGLILFLLVLLFSSCKSEDTAIQFFPDNNPILVQPTSDTSIEDYIKVIGGGSDLMVFYSGDVDFEEPGDYTVDIIADNEGDVQSKTYTIQVLGDKATDTQKATAATENATNDSSQTSTEDSDTSSSDQDTSDGADQENPPAIADFSKEVLTCEPRPGVIVSISIRSIDFKPSSSHARFITFNVTVDNISDKTINMPIVISMFNYHMADANIGYSMTSHPEELAPGETVSYQQYYFADDQEHALTTGKLSAALLDGDTFVDEKVFEKGLIDLISWE